MAKWRLASLVKAVDAAFVAQLLASCDRHAATGRRDFVIVLLLSRLGLRVAEVTALRLEDLDWRAGELAISATRRPPSCCAPGRACARSGRCCATAAARVTSIYTKVDRRALAVMVQPWPGTAA